ncbi:MAG: hypothetical protein Q9165_002575 [Trypethelium subeluteriae]
MPSTTKPAIIVVHGAWQTVLVYYPLLEALSANDRYDLYIPHLRSCNSPPSSTTGLADDAAVIRTELTVIRRADPSRKIILLMHSYGGAVGSEALNPNLGGRGEIPGGLDDIYLVYFAAFMIPRGFSCASAYVDPSYRMTLLEDGATIPKDPEDLFFNGLPDDVKEQEARKIVKHNARAMMDCVKFEAWRELGLGKGPQGEEGRLRVWYVVFEDDHAIPESVQRRFVQAVRREGVLVRETSLKVGHSPFRDEAAVKALLAVVSEVEEEMEATS